MVPRARDIWRFWLDEVIERPECIEDRSNLWFSATPAQDAEIRRLFEADVKRAGAGQLDAWKKTAQGHLVLIVLLDQFPRNIYRGRPEAFEFDEQALRLCLVGLDRKIDQTLTLVEQVFFYMPLQHAEDAVAQRLSVEKSEQHLKETPAVMQKFVQDNYKYAIQHQRIIDRFGRFPHRNPILGRTPTAEERDYLAKGGSTFGQAKRKR
ncbi:MAG: DUF924 domain-containing protein [Gammaproteobacteria bacterium]|nr:DUF924 domain-containing protein [Gammaproteobacteria bacterium]